MKTSLFFFSVASVVGVLFPRTTPAQSTGQTDLSGESILFEQPFLTGIAGNFHVPIAEHRYPSDKPFNLILWQPNPNEPDGQLVATSWPAGDMTGFYPEGKLAEHQAAFRDAPGASTVQIEGGTVGVYLNSRDLSHGSNANLMMITPAFRLPKARDAYPFVHPGVAIVESLDLQIPVAKDLDRKGNLTYVVADLEFEDRQSRARISYNITLFRHTPAPGTQPTQEWLQRTEVVAYDAPTHSFIIGNPLTLGSRVVTPLTRSSLFQTQPWTGWRSFRFAVTQDNFKTNLLSLNKRAPAFGASENPADYILNGWHLNAEIVFATGPAELGWSMRKARVALVPDDRLDVLH